MDPRDAALRVLQDAAGEDLHWTVIWDRALRAAYIDPFTQRDARNGLVRALAEMARGGEIEKTSKGTYRIAPDG